MTTDEYMRVGGGVAPKVARHSKEAVYFDLLKNQSGEVFIRMIHTKEDKGKFSDEIIPLWLIYNCVEEYISTNKSISAQPFKGCFTKYITNSPGFLAAVLRELGLFKEDPVNSEKHLVTADAKWTEFETKMLAIDGEPYTP